MMKKPKPKSVGTIVVRLLAHFRLHALILFALTALPVRGEFGTPLRPPSFSGHVSYRAVASQPGNTTSYLAVGRAWTGSNYQGVIASFLTTGGFKNGDFSKGSTAWYPGQTFIDFSAAGFDNLCSAAVYAYDGYIVACRSMKSNGYYDIYLAKVNSSGVFDSSFGTNGIVTTGLGGNSTNGHGFARGIAYNSAVNSSHHGVVTVVGTLGTNSTNYRPYAASFDQQTGAAWGAKVSLTDYVGTAVGVIYDSTTSNAYYVAATETVAPHHFYVHKFTYSGDADTSLDEAASPWGDALDFSVAGGGSESVPTGIALGSTGAWGVDIVISGSNRPTVSTGHWRCAAVALESSSGDLRSGYGYAGITGGVSDEGITLVTHDANNDCILNSATDLGSGQTALLGAAYTSGSSNYDQLTIKIDGNGDLVSAFGSSGFKIVSAGPADDVNNGAVKIGSYLYTGGRVHNASLYQGGDVQRIDITSGAPAPTITSISTTTATATSGQAATITVTATLSDASTIIVPLSSMNLSTSDSAKLSLGTSSAFAFSGVSGAATISAVLSETLSENIGLTIAAPDFPTSNLRADWNAKLACMTSAYTAGASPRTWYDLSPSDYDATVSSSSHSSWAGTGTYSSPYAVTFDGQGYVDMGTSVLGSQTRMLLSTWTKATDVNSSSDGVIIGNSTNATGNGFTLRHHPSYRDVVMSLSPVAYWRLGERSGTSAANLGGSGGTGTLTNGTVPGAAGGLNGDTDMAMTFDGTNDYVATSLAMSPATYSSLTMSAWVKPATVAAGWRTVFAGDDGGWDRSLVINSSSYTLQVGNTSWNTGATAAAGRWDHVVAIWTASSIKFYLNGYGPYSYGSGGSFGTSSQALQIGADTACGSCYFNGVIDEVAVFNTELTAAQVHKLYRAGRRGKTVDLVIGKSYEDLILADSPVAYWRMGDASGSTALMDISGNGYNAVLGGSYTLGSSGKLSGDADTAVTFASNAYATMGSMGTMPTTGTIEMWLNQSSLSNYPNVFSTHNNGNVGIRFEAASDGSLLVSIGNDAASSQKVAYFASSGLSASTWYHIAFVWDKTQNKLWTYLNGSVVENGTANSIWPTSFTNVVMGVGFTNRYFNGRLDEVAIYNTALNSTQIAAHYAAGSATYGGICTSTSSLSEGLWTNLAALFSGSAATLYVNGRQDCTVSVSSGFSTPNSGLYAGATSSATKGLTGSVAEVKVYGTSDGSAPGTATDVKTLFDASANTYRQFSNSGIVTSNLVFEVDAANAKQGLRPFSNGCTVNDLSWFDLTSSALTGTLTNFSSCSSSTGWNGDGTTSVSGTAGPYRLTLDGSNDYVAFGTTNIPYGSSARTVEAWIYPTGNGGTILGVNAASGQRYLVQASNYSGTWYLFTDAINGANNLTISGGELPTSSAWNHFVFTLDGSNGWKYYINGTLKKSGTFSTSINTSTPTSVWVGDRADWPGNQAFAGSIARVSVYSKALSQSEVSQNCNALKSRFASVTCN